MTDGETVATLMCHAASRMVDFIYGHLGVEDLERYPDSGWGDIHRRIGPEIHEKAVGRALEALLGDGSVVASGEGRWRKYRLAMDKGHHS